MDRAREGPDLRIRTGVRRGVAVTFTFEGRAVQGHAGESVAAALWAAGVRSAADDAYRVLFCAMGICQQCAVWIDGCHVEACRVPVRDGMVVRTTPPAIDA